MEIQKLTVTTPNPWGNDHVQGDLTIAPKVASATKGSDLLAVLSTPSGKIDAGVESDAVPTPADGQANMFMMQVVPSNPHMYESTIASAVVSPSSRVIVFNSVPESGTAWALLGTITLGLVLRHLRRR